ncbi:MAG: UTP--glucose-1-phosphate uridylyltransferase [Spirochaetales bacterium]|nr:UTP--glucose-1-phosphate uridylyltransferase [Spirochaetales bacterium]
MKEKGIDIGLSAGILEKYNRGEYDHFVPVLVAGIPEIDGRTIIDVTGDIEETITLDAAQKRIDELGISIDLAKIGEVSGKEIRFDCKALRRLGVLLYPLLSYGILNGGSASSYVDYKKNHDFNETLFDICREEFEAVAEVSREKAKGITPAFINENKEHGPSFLELKMRMLLIEALRYQEYTGKKAAVLRPMFQMTSVYNNSQIEEAYGTYKKGGYLEPLIQETGIDITDVATGIQPMLSAFSHSSMGRPKTFFTGANGKPDSPLPMPGGHGQNFIVLKDIYKRLYREGKRFVCLGNVDNLGFTVDPRCLALLALRDKSAGFDFAFKTRVDNKGGVLIVDQNGKLNCADIGAAVSKEAIEKIEREGKKILFNCATGLFNLSFLVSHLDDIIKNLPVRFTDQDKDAGRYSQAEQVTWEVIGLIDDLLIFGVDKYERFLAAKLLLEGLMTSGVGMGHPDYPEDEEPSKDLKSIAGRLNRGLHRLLENAYGLKKEGMRWVPASIEEIKSGMRRSP